MGRVITFAGLPYREAATGVKRAPITGGDMKEMSAEVIRLARGARLTEEIPEGSDRYLFTLTGGATVSGRGRSVTMAEEAFAVIEEGTKVTLTNPNGAEAMLISVLAPPANSVKRPGFSGGIVAAARASTPVHDLPAEKKQRIYFIGKGAAHSERAHAMIVVYVKDTVTSLHMHPNAESMFVFLSGKTRFTVGGKDVIVERGRETCFTTGGRPGLRVEEGDGARVRE